MDRRIKKTRYAIQQVVLDKLSKKEFSKITMTEVIQAADCSRSTFYLHFKDVFDVYEQLGEELISDVVRLLEESYQEIQAVDYTSLSQQIVTFAAEKRDLVKLFFGEQADGTMVNKLDKAIFEEVAREEQLASNDLFSVAEITFIVAGIIHVLSRWLTFDEATWHQETMMTDLTRILEKF